MTYFRPLAVASLAFLLGSAGRVGATVFTIVDPMAPANTAQVDTSGGAGLFSWIVNGQQELFDNHWFVRGSNDTKETDVTTLTATILKSPGGGLISTNPDVVDVQYTNPGKWQFELQYDIDGPDNGAFGPYNSKITTTVTLANLDSAQTFRIWKYSDPMALGTQPNDLGQHIPTSPEGSVLFDSESAVTLRYLPALGKLPDFWTLQNGNANGVGSPLLTSLQDNAITPDLTLASEVSPVTGNVILAYEWLTPTLVSGGSNFTTFVTKEVSVIPEPASAALLLLGLVPVVRRWRRRE